MKVGNSDVLIEKMVRDLFKGSSLSKINGFKAKKEGELKEKEEELKQFIFNNYGVLIESIGSLEEIHRLSSELQETFGKQKTVPTELNFNIQVSSDEIQVEDQITAKIDSCWDKIDNLTEERLLEIVSLRKTEQNSDLVDALVLEGISRESNKIVENKTLTCFRESLKNMLILSSIIDLDRLSLVDEIIEAQEDEFVLSFVDDICSPTCNWAFRVVISLFCMRALKFCYRLSNENTLEEALEGLIEVFETLNTLLKESREKKSKLNIILDRIDIMLGLSLKKTCLLKNTDVVQLVDNFKTFFEPRSGSLEQIESALQIETSSEIGKRVFVLVEENLFLPRFRQICSGISNQDYFIFEKVIQFVETHSDSYKNIFDSVLKDKLDSDLFLNLIIKNKLKICQISSISKEIEEYFQTKIKKLSQEDLNSFDSVLEFVFL